jgi:hypothetical protein
MLCGIIIMLDVMRSRGKTLIFAFVFGVLLTVCLDRIAEFVDQRGAESVARVLSWPNTFLQGLVPGNNIGSPERPLYEGTPLNSLAYVVSFPLAIVVYTSLAYGFIRWRSANAV